MSVVRIIKSHVLCKLVDAELTVGEAISVLESLATDLQDCKKDEPLSKLIGLVK